MNTNSSTGAKQSVNVGKVERIASIIAGGVLLYKVLKDFSDGQEETPYSGATPYDAVKTLYRESNTPYDPTENFYHSENVSKPKGNTDKKKIAMAIAGGYLAYRGITGHCDVYKLAGKRKLPDTVKNINIRTLVTVNKPREDVYAFWRKLSNLPLFMSHLKSVEVLDDKRSHWEAKIPGDVIKLEWDAEIVKEIEGELISWNSLPHASIQNAGKVEFRDADENGTEIRVVITYRAPFGDVGEGITSLFNPMFEKMIKKDVKNFKRYIETGENALAES
jgi:uncharacterized membrane protein